MLRMQEGEGHSQLCLDRLQLEAIHKVKAWSHLLHLSSLSFPPNSGHRINEMGNEHITETAEKGKQLWRPHHDRHSSFLPLSPHHGLILSDCGPFFFPSCYSYNSPQSTNCEHLSFVFCSLHRSASAQTWIPMDGWYLGDSQGWFGSILSVDSPHHWATVCSLKAEPTSLLCSSRPPLLKGLASLQLAIAFCPVPSRGPHRTFGMKSARNKWPPTTGP